jgi:hypothetical protein
LCPQDGHHHRILQRFTIPGQAEIHENHNVFSGILSSFSSIDLFFLLCLQWLLGSYGRATVSIPASTDQMILNWYA